MMVRKRKRRRRAGGFSLIEVALALGIVSFALLTVVALLPIGISTNQASSEELHASNLLSFLNADLRNTDPRLASAHAGASALFGLPLPYQVSASGKLILNSRLSPVSSALSTVPSDCTTGIDAADGVVATGTLPPAPYQVTVLYSAVPATGNAPIQARLIVNWPCLRGATIADLTDRTKVRGYVEACVTYPAP